MSGESDGTEKNTALVRREYWQKVYEAAVAAHDDDTAARASRFVQEYDAFLALLERGGESG